MKSILLSSLLLTNAAFALSLESIEFESEDGQVVDAELGRIEVPARHDDPDDDNRLTLSFVRFPATTANPGPPIVYLAGGPGGSGIRTAKGRRFSLFMDLRQFGDVIALDQRGTGQSEPGPRCEADERFPIDEPFTREHYVPYALAAARACIDRWRDQGVDLGAFTTWESAGDLEVLREALGAEKLTLWAISYGTHLAMAAVKRMGDEHIDRLVLASPEGLDQTVKLPERWDAYYERLASHLADQPAAAAAYPHPPGALRELLDRLAAEPVAVEIQPGDADEPLTIRIGPMAVQRLLAGMGKNPESAVMIPVFIQGMLEGDFERLAEIIYWAAYARPARYGAMPLVMDYASGVSQQRLAKVQRQAQAALMGDMLNYPMPHFDRQLDLPTLDASFRQPLKSEVPALVLTGTLDGRTFPEAHAAVLSQFSNGHHLVIENAGHDLFMASPQVGKAIEVFLQGGEPADRLEIAAPEFPLPDAL